MKLNSFLEKTGKEFNYFTFPSSKLTQGRIRHKACAEGHPQIPVQRSGLRHFSRRVLGRCAPVIRLEDRGEIRIIGVAAVLRNQIGSQVRIL